MGVIFFARATEEEKLARRARERAGTLCCHWLSSSLKRGVCQDLPGGGKQHPHLKEGGRGRGGTTAQIATLCFHTVTVQPAEFGVSLWIWPPRLLTEFPPQWGAVKTRTGRGSHPEGKRLHGNSNVGGGWLWEEDCAL